MSCFITVFLTIPYHISIIDFTHIQIIILPTKGRLKILHGWQKRGIADENFGRTGEKFLKGGAKKSIFQWPRYTTEATMRKENDK